MGYESFGFGAIYTESSDSVKEFNQNVLNSLHEPSEIGEYAALNKSVFKMAEGRVEAVCWTQIIHFGFSAKGRGLDDIKEFIEELDFLLNQLSWDSATAFFDTWTGEYIYKWTNLDEKDYTKKMPQIISPVTKWNCKVRKIEPFPHSELETKITFTPSEQIVEIREQVNKYKKVKFLKLIDI